MRSRLVVVVVVVTGPGPEAMESLKRTLGGLAGMRC